MHIVDRRRNPGGKSLANRQRFLRRAKAVMRDAVRDNSQARGIKDLEQGGEITIPADSIREPRFERSRSSGQKQAVLPGNKKFIAGDTLPKDGEGGGGAGNEGSPEGEGEDGFRFVLSTEEYLDLFFEDLELPNMAKRTLAVAESHSLTRAGYSVSGSPANLAVTRTLRNSLARRFALRRPNQGAIDELRGEIDRLVEEDADADEILALQQELDRLVSRSRRVPYIDPMDLRYRRFEAVPRPVSQAVMFCLMDTSASMTSDMKDLAKRFFALLYIFLKRRYQHVETVFIRHTQRAEEVDENTFFHSPETGGTLVSSALEKMQEIVAARFDLESWNIYGAQASDGDNTSSDSERTLSLISEAVLPVCQYFAYVQVERFAHEPRAGFMPSATELWRVYEKVQDETGRFAMCKVSQRSDIYPVFRKLFERKANREGEPA